MFYTKFIVRKHERGLLYQDGDFQQFLEPGVHHLFDPRSRYSLQVFDMGQPAFEHTLIDYLVVNEADEVSRLFNIVQTSTQEVAIVFFNDRPFELIGPAERKLYWKGLVTIRIERFDVSESPKLPTAQAKRLLETSEGQTLSRASNAIYVRIVQEGHVGLLYVDGVLTELLNPGTHTYLRYQHEVRIEMIDMRVNALEVSGQEILTRDKVSLRINLTATFQMRDALVATRAAKDPIDHLYKEVQFGLRAAVGTRSLDALLEDKSVINRAVVDHVAESFAAIGIDVLSIGVKDIILPGDMKELLGKVVEAEKAAQANVIRRREETNATRSLLNTAKVMESNQVALRLKELETLEKVTEKVGNLSVYGGLDGVLNGLIQLKQ